jgi:BMFP domain-containing protein YqiC
MQGENRFFDDLSRLINGAAGTFAGMGREMEANARERFKDWVGGLDYVHRDEFEAVKAMAAAAREEVETLKAQIAALQGASNVARPRGEAPAKGAVEPEPATPRPSEPLKRGATRKAPD